MLRNIGSFEKSKFDKSGVKLQCLTETNPEGKRVHGSITCSRLRDCGGSVN